MYIVIEPSYPVENIVIDNHFRKSEMAIDYFLKLTEHAQSLTPQVPIKGFGFQHVDLLSILGVRPVRISSRRAVLEQ